MRAIGIDQSYTGFGYSANGDAKKKGFPLSKYDSETHRLWNIREWFTEWLTDQYFGSTGQDLGKPSVVVMEGYANAAKFGREVAGELGGTIKLVVFEVTGSPPLVVPPTSLKKFVTGKGNAKKNEMLLGVYKQWGVSFADDNQADAYALEQFGLGYLGSTPELHKYQWEAIYAVSKKA